MLGKHDRGSLTFFETLFTKSFNKYFSVKVKSRETKLRAHTTLALMTKSLLDLEWVIFFSDLIPIKQSICT